MTEGSNTYYYHLNVHGDVEFITDQTSTIVASYQYDSFGNHLNITGLLGILNPIRYAGYYYDEETTMFYLMARYYYPQHGNFLSMDPQPGDEQNIVSQNGYTFGNNNLVMNVDPSGELVFLLWMVKGTILSGLIAFFLYILKVRLGIIKCFVL